MLLVSAAVVASCSQGEYPMGSPSARADSASHRVRPAPPASYAVPRRAVRVSTSAQLRSVLKRSEPTAVVLADGVYGGSEPFLNPFGHRLYAATLGGAVLRVGLSLGGNAGRPGGLVRGVVFDVRDPAKTVEGAEIEIWGTSRQARVLDVTLEGNRVVPSGLVVREPDGFAAARIVARGFTDYGILVDANDPERTRLARPFRLTDVDVAGVSRETPRSSQGRSEACLWIGNPGVVRRARARRCAWTGLWTGTATTGALFDHIDVDETPTGVYVEHFTRRSTFQRLRVGPTVRVGVVSEWDDPGWGGRAAGVGNVIQDSRFDSELVGVYLDSGTTSTTVRRSTFVNQRWAAIGDYRGVENSYYGNDYSGIARGAEQVTDQHVGVIEEAAR